MRFKVKALLLEEDTTKRAGFMGEKVSCVI